MNNVCSGQAGVRDTMVFVRSIPPMTKSFSICPHQLTDVDLSRAHFQAQAAIRSPQRYQVTLLTQLLHNLHKVISGDIVVCAISAMVALSPL